MFSICFFHAMLGVKMKHEMPAVSTPAQRKNFPAQEILNGCADKKNGCAGKTTCTATALHTDESASHHCVRTSLTPA
jgi:hypothetical protein